MTQDLPTTFIETINFWGMRGAYVFLSCGALILLYHLVQLIITRDKKARYDFINLNEIKLLWYTSLSLLISAGLYYNFHAVEVEMFSFIIKILVTTMVATLIGVVINNLLKFYYPFFIEKRLKKLRYSPRISPKTGKPMKLLSEQDEDVYLDEGMQAEENLFSVDYDVWIDEETLFTKIEKYMGHLHANQCPECRYQTFMVTKEEIIKSPSTSEGGELIKFYKCSFCNHKQKKAFKIAKLREKPELVSHPLATT